MALCIRPMEFTGEPFVPYPWTDAFTMANMAIRGGRKAGYLPGRPENAGLRQTAGKTALQGHEPDSNAEYAQVIEYTYHL